MLCAYLLLRKAPAKPLMTEQQAANEVAHSNVMPDPYWENLQQIMTEEKTRWEEYRREFAE